MGSCSCKACTLPACYLHFPTVCHIKTFSLATQFSSNRHYEYQPLLPIVLQFCQCFCIFLQCSSFPPAMPSVLCKCTNTSMQYPAARSPFSKHIQSHCCIRIYGNTAYFRKMFKASLGPKFLQRTSGFYILECAYNSTCAQTFFL